MSHTQILGFIAKMREFDQDDRYMAISDLLALLKDGMRTDGLENEICTALLQRLDVDKSNDVQTITISCLSELLKRCDGVLITGVCDALADRILKTKSQIKDVYSIGLKTIIDIVPEASGRLVSSSLITSIITGISQQEEVIKIEFLDILPKLLARFGGVLDEHLPTITSVTLDQLKLGAVNVSKRASRVFFQLAPWLSDGVLSSLVETLLRKIDNSFPDLPAEAQDSESSSDSSSSEDSDDDDDEQNVAPSAAPDVQSIAAVTESVAPRLKAQSSLIVKTMLKAIGRKKNKRMVSKAFIELREQCFATIDACIRAQHDLGASLIKRIIDCGLTFLSFDPNFIEDSDSEDSDSDSSDDESDVSEDEVDQYDVEFEDSDDTSWKVRQSCLSLLSSLVGGSHQAVREEGPAPTTPAASPRRGDVNSTVVESAYLSVDAYGRCFRGVMARFGERVPAVQHAVLECLSAYVRFASAPPLGQLQSFRATATQIAPEIASASTKFLKTHCSQAAVKRKSSGLRSVGTVLQLLGDVLHLSAANPVFTVDSLITPLGFAMTQGDVILKLAAFRLVEQTLLTPAAAVTDNTLDSLMTIVLEATNDRWYRVATSALTIVLAYITRFLSDDPNDEEARAAAQKYATRFKLTESLTPLAFGAKKDQAVKELALQCLSELIARSADALGHEAVVVFLSESRRRLGSDVLCVSVLQALRRVAQTRLKLRVENEAVSLLHVLFENLRQSDRKMKVLSLELMNDLCALLAQSQELGTVSTDLASMWRKCDDIVHVIKSGDVYFGRLAYSFLASFTGIAPINEHADPVVGSVVAVICATLGRTQHMQPGTVTLNKVMNFLQVVSQRSPSLRSKAVSQFLLAGSGKTKNKTVESSARDGGARLAASAVCISASFRTSTDSGDWESLLSSLALVEAPNASSDAAVTSVTEAMKSALSSEDTSMQNLLLRTLGELCRCEPDAVVGNPALLLTIQNALQNGEPTPARAFALGSAARANDDVFNLFWSFCRERLASPDITQPTVQFVLEAISHMLAADTSSPHRKMTSERCHEIMVSAAVPTLRQDLSQVEAAITRVLGHLCGSLLLLSPTMALESLAGILKDEGTSPIAQREVLVGLQTFVSEANAGAHLDAALEVLLCALVRHNGPPKVALQAVSTMNALVHHHPTVLNADNCKTVWVAVMGHMPVRADLKRVVDLGPFKQKVDDGLPIRKAAYTCATTLLQQVPVSVTRQCGSGPNGFFSQLVASIIAGLKETEYDARILTQQVLLKLCAIDEDATSGRAAELLKPFAAKLGKTKLQIGDPVTSKQQERNLVTASVRTLFALHSHSPPHPLASRPEFKDLIKLIDGKPFLKAIWQDAVDA